MFRQTGRSYGYFFDTGIEALSEEDVNRFIRE